MDVLSRLRQAIGAASNVHGGIIPSTPHDSPKSASEAQESSQGTGSRRRNMHPNTLAFRDTWLKIRNTLTAPDQAALHHGIERTHLREQVQTLCGTLIFEANRADEDAEIAGPCMEMLLEGDILGQLVKLTANDRIAGTQAEVVGLFATLIILLDERFLSRQAVHRPLVRLLRICIGEESTNAALFTEMEADVAIKDEEILARRRFGRLGSAETLGFTERLVELMCHTASRLRNSPELLIIFFRERGGDEQSRRAFNIAMSGSSGTPSRMSTRASSPSGMITAHSLQLPRSSQPAVSSPLRPLDASPILPESPLPSTLRNEVQSQASSSVGLPFDFPLFSYLTRFIHRESRTGELARAGVLFLVDVAFAPGRRNIPRSVKTGNKGHTHLGNSSPKTTDRLTRSPRDSSGRRSGTSTPQKSRREIDLGLGPSVSLARFIMESDFTEVLGAGLGAVYGILPTKLKLSRPVGSSTGDGLMDDPVLGDDEANTKPDSGVASLRSFYSTPPADPMSKEVRDQTRLLCDILEFIQDILRTTSRKTRLPDSTARASTRDSFAAYQSSSELKSIARSFAMNLYSAVQSLFLDNILYPSMLECSDHDGSATAVLTYLEAILSVLTPDEDLAHCVMGWLIGADGKDEEGDAATVGRLKRKKRKSTAMLQLERERVAPEALTTSTYFSDVHGRYTIRDLIVDNLQPSVQSPATVAALRLASTIFTFHGRFVLRNVIQADVDDSATLFPSVIFGSTRAEKIGSSSVEADREDEEYPDAVASKDVDEAEQHLSALTRQMDYESYRTNSIGDIRRYLKLLKTMQKGEGIDFNQEDANGAASQSTGIDNYLEDAQASVRQDSMYAAALLLVLSPSQAEDGNGDATVAPVWRHRVSSNDRLIRVMLGCLCRYWSNTPSVNLAMSGFLAAFLSCPLRSLDGFVFTSSTDRVAQPCGDDNSDDDVFRSKASGMSKVHKRSPDVVRSEPVLLCVLHSLIETLNSVRKGVDDFDHLIEERKNGLLFVEKLDEVLEVNSMGMMDKGEESASAASKSPLVAFGSVDRGGDMSGRKKSVEDFVDVDQHIARYNTAKTTQPLILPLPPSAPTSQNNAGDGLNADRSPGAVSAERSTFARLFGRKKSKASRNHEADVNSHVEQKIVTPTPFAQHCLQTARIGIEVSDVQLSKTSPWCATLSSAPTLDVVMWNQVASIVNNGEVAEKRTRFKGVDDEESFTYPGEDGGKAVHIASAITPTEASKTIVSLNLLLDNAVILEELIKELVAIILVRRAYGIDST